MMLVGLQSHLCSFSAQGGQADGMSPSSPSFGTLAGACGYGALPQDK